MSQARSQTFLGTVGNVVLTATGVLPYLKSENRRVEKEFAENVATANISHDDLIAASPKKKEFSFTKKDAADLAMASMLVYQSAPKIAKKSAQVTNDKGEKYLKDEGETVQIWDAQNEEYIELDKLYTAQHKDGLQLASYYNQKTNEVLWNFGGTDFTNVRDLAAGGQVISGGLAPRMLSAGKAVKETLAALAKKFTSIHPKDVTHKAYMHSTGVQSYAASLIEFAKEKLSFSEAYEIDGFGGQAAFQAVAKNVAKGDKALTEKMFNETTQGIVSFNAHNEIEKFLMPLKKTDHHNRVGSEHAAD